MAAHAVRGMSAPPEVVFNTATDPDRRAAWLPGPWRTDAAQAGDDTFEVRIVGENDRDFSGVLLVRAGAAGGSSVELRVDESDSGPGTGSDAVEQILDSLEREVVDNFNFG